MVSAQEEPLPDYEYYDELPQGGDLAVDEAAIPPEEPVTEATTVKPKPTKPEGRKRLIPIRRIPNRDRPRTRPPTATRSPVTQAITEAPAASAPVQNTRTRTRGRRPSRVSTATQAPETAADTAQAQTTSSRSRFSRPGTRRTPSRNPSAAATTEATLTTTHRFGGRRRLNQRTNSSPAANQETDNATPAPSRFARRRRI